MISINIVEYNNKDFIQLCSLLEKEHIEVIKEQRSPKGNWWVKPLPHPIKVK